MPRVGEAGGSGQRAAAAMRSGRGGEDRGAGDRPGVERRGAAAAMPKPTLARTMGGGMGTVEYRKPNHPSNNGIGRWRAITPEQTEGGRDFADRYAER